MLISACPSCGNRAASDWITCPHCGEAMTVIEVRAVEVEGKMIKRLELATSEGME